MRRQRLPIPPSLDASLPLSPPSARSLLPPRSPPSSSSWESSYPSRRRPPPPCTPAGAPTPPDHRPVAPPPPRSHPRSASPPPVPLLLLLLVVTKPPGLLCHHRDGQLRRPSVACGRAPPLPRQPSSSSSFSGPCLLLVPAAVFVCAQRSPQPPWPRIWPDRAGPRPPPPSPCSACHGLRGHQLRLGLDPGGRAALLPARSTCTRASRVDRDQLHARASMLLFPMPSTAQVVASAHHVVSPWTHAPPDQNLEHQVHHRQDPDSERQVQLRTRRPRMLQVPLPPVYNYCRPEDVGVIKYLSERTCTTTVAMYHYFHYRRHVRLRNVNNYFPR